MSDQGTTPSSDQTANTSDQSAATSQSANNQAGQGLPQTASPLPLLALAGFAALALGILILKR